MTNQEKLEQDINDIKNAINSIAGNVRRIERALARDRYIPTLWHSISYSHKTRQLIFDKRYPMQFEKNEADLLGGLFYRGGKKAGQPKMGELLLSKVAKENTRLNLKPSTQKAVYQAFKRIYDRVLSETCLEIYELNYTTLMFNDFSKMSL
jgi:hypothetical protein